MKKYQVITLVMVLLIGLSGFAHFSHSAKNSSPSAYLKQTKDIGGLYKTSYNKNYLEAYGTKRYSTLEFKEGNKAELKVITDNSNSTLKSKTGDCHVETYTDYLQYKMLENNKISFICLSKRLDYCGSTENAPACFEYELSATLTADGIVMENELFIKE